MTLVDSSGWLEIFQSGPNSVAFQARLPKDEQVLVPTVVLHEVYKVLLRDSTEEKADRAAALLKSQSVAPLDEQIALHAAALGLRHKLSLADAVVYATAQLHGAIVLTGDAHFALLSGVDYISKTQ